MIKYVLANLKVTSIKNIEVYDEECRQYREKHTIKITNIDNKESKFFTYTTETLQYINRENLLKKSLWCIFMDYNTYLDNDDVNCFIDSFGYDFKEGHRIFNAILRSGKRFEKLLNSNTIEALENEFKDY